MPGPVPSAQGFEGKSNVRPDAVILDRAFIESHQSRELRKTALAVLQDLAQLFQRQRDSHGQVLLPKVEPLQGRKHVGRRCHVHQGVRKTIDAQDGLRRKVEAHLRGIEGFLEVQQAVVDAVVQPFLRLGSEHAAHQS
eukprot:scaffold736_cov254-Pinguiococcus_pyrenoidosus.AAC.6